MREGTANKVVRLDAFRNVPARSDLNDVPELRSRMDGQPASESGPAALGHIDIRRGGSNNRAMAKPEAVRRIKSYSAANGYVYQYCFYEVNRVELDGQAAGEFIYAISADRAKSFGLRILVMQSALEAWALANGRALTSSEEYAVAKMRLFQAFDEGEASMTAETAAKMRLMVDEANLEEMLRLLNI